MSIAFLLLLIWGWRKFSKKSSSGSSFMSMAMLFSLGISSLHSLTYNRILWYWLLQHIFYESYFNVGLIGGMIKYKINYILIKKSVLLSLKSIAICGAVNLFRLSRTISFILNVIYHIFSFLIWYDPYTNNM